MRLLREFVVLVILIIVIQSVYITFSSEINALISIGEIQTYSVELNSGETFLSNTRVISQANKLSYIIEKRREYNEMLLSAQQMMDIYFQ